MKGKSQTTLLILLYKILIFDTEMFLPHFLLKAQTWNTLILTKKKKLILPNGTKTLYCSVNHVFSMKVLIGDSILTSPNRDRAAIFV